MKEFYVSEYKYRFTKKDDKFDNSTHNFVYSTQNNNIFVLKSEDIYMENAKTLSNQPLLKDLTENLDIIKKHLGEVNDLLIRELILQDGKQTKAAVLGIDGLVNTTDSQDFIIKLMTAEFAPEHTVSADALFGFLRDSWISMLDTKQSDNFEELYDNLLTGHNILLVDGCAQLLMFDNKGFPARGVGVPNAEKTLWGPLDSFVETIRFNTALLRRRLKDPRLRFDSYKVGRMSKTDVFVAHVEGLTNPEFVRLAKERIEAIDIDTITNSYELIQLIEDKHHSLLPRLIETERPDRVMKALSEGQVAIFVDGSPYAILGPFHLTSAFSAVDDYYNHPAFATVKRLMRYIAFFSIILIPGFYIAMTNFHQNMIPTQLLITIINQRSANPFSTFVEIIIIISLFEIIREASLRKPDAIGDSMTIAASLIVGTTIVESGLVSYAAIIVGCLTTLASFMLSNSRINTAARLFKFGFMIIGATLGFYGLTLAFIILILHLTSLTSFNQAYLAPMAPFNIDDQKDQIIKASIWHMKKRPKIFGALDKIRENTSKAIGNKGGN